jgi:N-acyl-L-homoserine lactone synthetase
MESEILKISQMPYQLTKSVFEDRCSQFVNRLDWDLCVTPEGYEADKYDDDQSEYLIVHNNMKHLGSCRIRSCHTTTMIMDYFLPSFPEAADFLSMQRGRVYELTRFCRSPHISVQDSRVMLSSLAYLLDTYRLQKEIIGYVAIVFPQVARFLDSIGVSYLVISKSNLDAKPIYMICITRAKSQKLRNLNFGGGIMNSDSALVA